jgi:protein-S-isoprenylcysteine O-methyltransferase Ste14
MRRSPGARRWMRWASSALLVLSFLLMSGWSEPSNRWADPGWARPLTLVMLLAGLALALLSSRRRGLGSRS